MRNSLYGVKIMIFDVIRTSQFKKDYKLLMKTRYEYFLADVIRVLSCGDILHDKNGYHFLTGN